MFRLMVEKQSRNKVKAVFCKMWRKIQKSDVKVRVDTSRKTQYI